MQKAYRLARRVAEFHDLRNLVGVCWPHQRQRPQLGARPDTRAATGKALAAQNAAGADDAFDLPQ